MENKYYTPDKEDFHLGYEFEVKYPIGWIKKKIENLNNDHDGFGGFSEAESDEVRTLYLTEDQIKKEGWKQWADRNHIFDKTIDNEKYQLQYQFDNHWAMIFDNDAKYVFRGFIKSINEFRKVMKMIAI